MLRGIDLNVFLDKVIFTISIKALYPVKEFL